MNRLWRRWQGETLLETYCYSASGRLTNRTDASGTHTWVYDVRDRLRTNTTPAGTLVYDYDANGNLTGISSSTPGGTAVTYQYDSLSRLTNVVDSRLSGTQNTAYRLDAVSRLQALRYPNGMTNLYQYDSLNRVTNLTWKLNASVLADFGYRLGMAGNRTNLSETVNGAGRSYGWEYDALCLNLTRQP